MEQMRFLPRCPQGLDHKCRLQQPVLDFSREPSCTFEWRHEINDEANALLGVFGGAPSNCCRCALAHARCMIIDWVDAPPPDAPAAIAAVQRLIAHGLGKDARVVVAISSPTRPAWMPS
jgi:hypothetical protein